MSDVTDRILAIERGFWTKADDPTYFAEHIAEGGVSVIEPMGVIEKVQAVSMKADAPWIDVEMSDVVIRQVSPDLVILAYHGSGRHAGDEEPYRGSIASAYARIDGNWQLALSSHQPWKARQ
jgi:hypothetical protein